jgi:hypothetical protein
VSGVRTVAVAVGKRRALLLSLLPLAAAAAVAAAAPSARTALAACGPLIAQGAFALSSLACDFTPASLGRAIELAPIWLLLSVLALTV